MDTRKIGNKIAMLRRQNGYTQEDLAGKLGITSQAVSKWENGHTLPETILLPLLSKFLKSSIDSILMPIDVNIGDRIQFGNFEWRVLDVHETNALIITEHVIEQRAFHSSMEIITWERSDIRKYLNGTFYNTFSLTEQEKILETKLTDRDNPWYNTKYGNDTEDYIFLLSYDEVVKYFGDSGDLKNRKGVDEGIGLPYGDAISDEYNKARHVFDLSGFDAWWWLRSPGGPRDHTERDHVTAGSVGNVIFLCGDDICRDDGGVRPALWLSFE